MGNKYAYERISELFKRSVSSYRSRFSDFYFYDNDRMRKDITEGIMRDLDFDEGHDFVRYRYLEEKDGITTNIVHVDAKSQNCEINQLIEKLNDLYERICSIKPVMDVEK